MNIGDNLAIFWFHTLQVQSQLSHTKMFDFGPPSANKMIPLIVTDTLNCRRVTRRFTLCPSIANELYDNYFDIKIMSTGVAVPILFGIFIIMRIVIISN